MRPGPSDSRERRGSFHIHQSVGDNRQLPMLPGNVEMVNEIADVILIRENPRLRTDGQLKREASLRVLAARLHAQFHYALPNGTAVPKTSEMPDRVEHQASRADWIG